MSMSSGPYAWASFRGVMAELAAISEQRYAELYRCVERYDRFVGRIVNRPHGIDTERPQDYLACVLTPRAFRLMIGGLWVSSCGYTDLSPNLGRTIWEIGVRLYYAQLDPISASLGFFSHADRRNLEALEVELAHRRSNGEAVRYLDQNCANLRRHHEWLTSVAASKGIDIKKAADKFGNMNVRQACQAIGIEKAYLVDYVLDSGHVHERDVTTDSFMSVRGRAGEYELGPSRIDAIPYATFDILRNFAIVADAAARLVEDKEAIAEAREILDSLLKAGKERIDGD